MQHIEKMIDPAFVQLEVDRYRPIPGITSRVETIAHAEVVGQRDECQIVRHRAGGVSHQAIRIATEKAGRLHSARIQRMARSIHCGHTGGRVLVLRSGHKPEIAGAG